MIVVVGLSCIICVEAACSSLVSFCGLLDMSMAGCDSRECGKRRFETGGIIRVRIN